MLDQRLSILTLGVRDLPKAREFYTKTLGWKPRSEDSNDNIVFFQLHSTLFALYGYDALAEDAKLTPDGSGFRGFTMAYNTNNEDEVNEIFEKLAKAGVTIVKQPEKVFWGGYSGYFSDPEGNLWEVAYNPYTSPEEIIGGKPQ